MIYALYALIFIIVVVGVDLLLEPIDSFPDQLADLEPLLNPLVPSLRWPFRKKASGPWVIRVWQLSPDSAMAEVDHGLRRFDAIGERAEARAVLAAFETVVGDNDCDVVRPDGSRWVLESYLAKFLPEWCAGEKVFYEP